MHVPANRPFCASRLPACGSPGENSLGLECRDQHFLFSLLSLVITMLISINPYNPTVHQLHWCARSVERERESLQSESQTPTRGQTKATRRQAKGGRRRGKVKGREAEASQEVRRESGGSTGATPRSGTPRHPKPEPPSPNTGPAPRTSSRTPPRGASKN